jgi:hypothetical protein
MATHPNTLDTTDLNILLLALDHYEAAAQALANAAPTPANRKQIRLIAMARTKTEAAMARAFEAASR